MIKRELEGNAVRVLTDVSEEINNLACYRLNMPKIYSQPKTNYTKTHHPPKYKYTVKLKSLKKDRT